MQAHVAKWLVMATSTLVPMLYLGLTFSFGSFLIPLLDTFNRDRTSTTTIVSLHVGFTIGFSVISGSLITHFGLHRMALVSNILVSVGFLSSYFASNIEVLYISIGIVTGIGNSTCILCSIIAISRVFSGSQRMLCLSIHCSSIAITGIAYPYLIEILVSNFGLKGSFLILAAVQSNAFTFSLVCFMYRDCMETNTERSINEANIHYKEGTMQNPEDTTSSTSDSTDTDKEMIIRPKMALCVYEGIQDAKSIMYNTKYTIILFASGITTGAINMYLGLIIDICIWKGFSARQGIFLLVVYNIATFIARLVPGILKQFKGISVFMFPLISCISGFIVGMLLYFGTNYYAQIAASSMVGVTIGTIIPLIPMICVKIIQTELVPVAIGLQFTFSGIVTALCGPIFGKLRDITGSYESVFMSIIVIHVIGVVMTSITLVLRKYEQSQEKNSLSTTVTTFD